MEVVGKLPDKKAKACLKVEKVQLTRFLVLLTSLFAVKESLQ